MNLKDFLEAKLQYGPEAIVKDPDLAKEIQADLVTQLLLDPPADGKFGPISVAALGEFQERFNLAERGFLGPETAKKLLSIDPAKPLEPTFKLTKSLASSIVRYMQSKKYFISIGPRRYNIVYIEGMGPTGTLNSDTPNCFNDARLVFQVLDGVPTLIGGWEATTEPGFFYTDNPMNPKGAARIAFNQYKAWKVGIHFGGGAEPHEALVQEAPITVFRDKNRDMMRTNDPQETGIFDINQHWGYDLPYSNIKFASAGCLVGRMRASHRDFMKLIKQDSRYELNRNYLYYTTIIPGDEMFKQFPW
jgi:hypothetical protein